MQKHSMASAAPATASLQRAIYQAKADWYAYVVASWDDDERDLPCPSIDPKLLPAFQSSRQVLEKWAQPATSRPEAFMALEMALEQYAIGDTPVIPAMIKAALGYLEGKAA